MLFVMVLDSTKFLEELLLAKAFSELKVLNFLQRTVGAVNLVQGYFQWDQQIVFLEELCTLQ